MITWTRSDALPIGLQIGSDAVRMAQVQSRGKEMELLAIGTASLAGKDGPGGNPAAPGQAAAIAQAISELVKSKPFKGKRCVLSLPAETVFIQHVKIPKVRPEQLPQVLRMELKGKLPESYDNMVVRHVVAGDVMTDGKMQQEVIVVAAPRDVVNRYLGAAEQAGLDVVGVEVEATAVVECFWHLLRRDDDASRAVLFVHLAASHTQVVLVHGRNMVFARNLSVGGQHLDSAVADGLGISVAEARANRQEVLEGRGNAAMAAQIYRLVDTKMDEIAKEFQQCLRYYESVFKNHPVELVIFVGSLAEDKYVCQALAKRLNLPAKIGDPLLGIHRAAGTGFESFNCRQAHPDCTIPVGLSLSAVWEH